jgi:hypothetical protein
VCPSRGWVGAGPMGGGELELGLGSEVGK